MRYISWVRFRSGRLLVVLFALVIYFLLLTVDGLRFFPKEVGNSSRLFLAWTTFGFSAFAGLAFLAVGTLVWLYARSRYVALFLICFSFTIMVAFVSETGAALNDPLLSAINNVSSALSLPLFSALLLVFPRNYLSLSAQSGDDLEAGQRRSSVLLLRAYLGLLVFLGFITALHTALSYLFLLRLPVWLNTIDYSYYLLVLTGILVTIVISYRRSSLRERQQLRLFVIGVILAFAPFLILTLLPLIFLPSYSVDAQISILTAIILPLALGYTILRYQVLVFDVYIRRAVAWLVSVVCLAVLGYLIVLFSNVFLLFVSEGPKDIFIAFALIVLVPCVWWLAHVLTERLFFNETAHYRRLIDAPELLSRETFNLQQASELITVAVVNAFETQEVCLFVLDEGTGCYHLSPALSDDDPNASSRSRLVQYLLQVVKPSISTGTPSPLIECADWLDAHVAVIDHVDQAKRPLLLSEASKSDAEQPTGLARFLSTTTSAGPDPLLVPVRAQGKMIGLLVLGERGDHQPYAGADFEAIDLILSRFSSVLETARLYRRASQHVDTLNTFYSANAVLEKAYGSIEEVAVAYVAVAAEAAEAGAEIWLYEKNAHSLYCVTYQGSGRRLFSPESIISLHEDDWSTCFYDSGGSQVSKSLSFAIPSCLSQRPAFPFAWLPLIKGQQQFGVLILTYPRPHSFSHEEKRILTMFAGQCAVAIENTEIAIALHAAYERQKELDHLKDQFMMTASHELRTPLTAVQGYIELLHQYNATLANETRAEFIAKAHRGCDELVLMVNNIMDASRVQVDVEQVQLSPVPLAEAVQHILEILEATSRRENRPIQVDVSPALFVMADDLRLRQVLLNLVTNALKYTPTATGIEISAHSDGEFVTVQVRDHGPGIPPDQHERLFERFVRLERDMNSPTRGAGLGLYISKQLIEAVGGRIWVDSAGEPGKGSSFIFTLKRGPRPAAPTRSGDQHILSGGATQ